MEEIGLLFTSWTDTKKLMQTANEEARALAQQQASESVETARELIKAEEELANLRQAVKDGLDDLEWANSELARLKAAPAVSFVCRNVLVRCKTNLLRDGGVERTALNVTTNQPFDLNSLLDERAFGGNPLLRRALFERIPLSEIGPYLHPGRAAAGR